MRLICPNCDAQYEVPDEVIPTEGRDVQCSECGQTWFQRHPDDPEPDDTTDDEAAAYEDDTPAKDEERAPTPDPQRRTLDPAVSDILREEAAQEARAREAEASALESQPDLGLDDGGPADDASRRAREARERMARIRGEDHDPDDTDETDLDAEAAAAAAAAGSRRDLLPDIEEINSTLRSTGDRQASGGAPSQDAETPKRGKRGFRSGFLMALIVTAILAALYVFAPQISALVPPLDGVLTAYVGWIDQMRVVLDDQVTRLLTWLDTAAASTASSESL